MRQTREKKGNKEQHQSVELVLATDIVITRRRVVKQQEESSRIVLQIFVEERVEKPHVGQAPLQPKPPSFK